MSLPSPARSPSPPPSRSRFRDGASAHPADPPFSEVRAGMKGTGKTVFPRRDRRELRRRDRRPPAQYRPGAEPHPRQVHRRPARPDRNLGGDERIAGHDRRKARRGHRLQLGIREGMRSQESPRSKRCSRSESGTTRPRAGRAPRRAMPWDEARAAPARALGARLVLRLAAGRSRRRAPPARPRRFRCRCPGSAPPASHASRRTWRRPASWRSRRAGRAPSPRPPAAPIQPGSAVGVQLVRGDVDMTRDRDGHVGRRRRAVRLRPSALRPG